MGSSSVCPRCGVANAGGDVFCAKCGTQIGSAPILPTTPPPVLVKRTSARIAEVLVVAAVAAVVAGFVLYPLAVALWHEFAHIGTPRGGPTIIPVPAADYDEQLLLVEASSFSSLVLNVGVDTQDAGMFGPAFLLNGLTETGWWYQVGVAVDWPSSNGYAKGFVFITQVWAPGNRPNPPQLVGMAVNPGDQVQLNLGVSYGDVVMEARDPFTGASQSFTYSAMGASAFEGLSSAPGEGRYFTGLMTEQYHVGPHYGPAASATYRSATPLPTQVLLGIEETLPHSGSVLFSNSEQVSLYCPCFQTFWYAGATESVKGSEFVTG